MVTGLFKDAEDLERAYQVVAQRGYGTGDINVLMSDDARRRYFASEPEPKTELASKVAEGGELGGPIGGTFGTLVPALVAAGGFLAFPALGLVIAGPIAAALTAAGAAGLAFGLMGALSDWGIPEERVRHYEAGIRDGGILIGVKVRSDDDARQIEQQWKAIGGRHVYS
jgi:hypothetical protein